MQMYYKGSKAAIADDSFQAVQNQFFLLGDSINSLLFDLWYFADLLHSQTAI